MSQLVLHLPDELAAMLDEISRASHRPAEEIAREMVEKALAIRRLETVREGLLSSLDDEAPKTDEEVFKEIS